MSSKVQALLTDLTPIRKTISASSLLSNPDRVKLEGEITVAGYLFILDQNVKYGPLGLLKGGFSYLYKITAQLFLPSFALPLSTMNKPNIIV